MAGAVAGFAPPFNFICQAVALSKSVDHPSDYEPETRVARAAQKLNGRSSGVKSANRTAA
jgi:hypothetical protein